MTKNIVFDAIRFIPGFKEIHGNFIEKLTIKGVSQRTIDAYSRNTAQIALFFNLNPLEPISNVFFS